MKKFLYLFSFLLLTSFFSINFVNADTIIPDLLDTYVGKFCNCNPSLNYCFFGINAYRNVFIYDTKNTSGNSLDFSLKYLNGNSSKLLNIGSSNTLYDIGNTSSSDHFTLLIGNNNPTIDNIYNFSTSERYIYASFTNSQIDGNYGSVEWIGSSYNPEPEPINIPDLIFIPQDDTYNKCYVVQNENVIRAYDTLPSHSASYNYRDYYINSSYIYKDGNGQWSQYSNLPICLAEYVITHDEYYRLDYYKSLIMFFIMSIFCIYLPIKLFSKIFRKGVL